MEENSLIAGEKKRNLGVFDILKESVTISTKSLYFLIFTLVTSLPLFFFCVYYEILLQMTLVEGIKILTPPETYFSRSWPMPDHFYMIFGKEFWGKLMYLLLLYLLPLQLLQLCTLLVTVYLASKIYTVVEEEEKPSMSSFKDMVLKAFNISRLSRTLITSLCVLLWSTTLVVPLTWFAANYYVNDAFFSILFSVAFLVVLFKRDRKRQGRLLMLVFFVWENGLRLASLFGGFYGGGNIGILVQIGLYCVGNVIKWVACLVYFYDCEKRLLEKKVDEELGRKAKASGQ
ncbi:hypothetical protein Tsubulata_015238 [Turnera subulata]|uniref:Transmembrane protein n=1 Tax=Turnera subulata TaxID=218843 RepID=A0A9Q0GAJ9_9ROSI|nr:hypothetical protein Tsubulata_015238 [Turnera subulata]